jgi:hypothetical protein
MQLPVLVGSSTFKDRNVVYRNYEHGTKTASFFLRFCFCILGGLLGPHFKNAYKFYPTPLLWIRLGDLLEPGFSIIIQHKSI